MAALGACRRRGWIDAIHRLICWYCADGHGGEELHFHETFGLAARHCAGLCRSDYRAPYAELSFPAQLTQLCQFAIYACALWQTSNKPLEIEAKPEDHLWAQLTPKQF